ncbi:MAG: hypothetical protein A2600_09020 [Candidatus Lambdaproteobacteria bacterium RIFOXYD1_FULL_56_27]|uniref:Uncharacterized protein n=1 Tax=Candidatus Lambdaproteobacteria bacterium RIFOXYD2_FULL_56_26 TaxID=1817773 RepID=A0A1F6GZ53_9PROT|nr:MAG: hypothetical protein A2426_10440 [Candidatus Lambdaproteobacteria bacterium RIFOXYC1_FULL_56_13]OGH03324.1 MAG: hypothetical protein A2557_02245 [Candidatus Lambdaproteobacteria bacterium RIFOXYD2_FULL_56_26]OGH06671.1 MAG: hypothetical protein A2600_09020 [Candidatus Lambdaproteobacteria bacterium RIFOXYD1_FULL_56_27]
MTQESFPLKSGKPDEGNQDKAEQYILTVFNQEGVQERLRAQMQKVVKDELARMSGLLKEAIRDWVIKEKARHNPEEERQKVLLLEERLENFEANAKQLEAENLKIQRQLELKEQENKMMLAGLQKMMGRKIR